MDAMEKERLTKAHHDAQFLAVDLRDVASNTENTALEILALEMMEQVQRINQRLYRLAKASASGCEFCRPAAGDPFTNRPRAEPFECPYCHTPFTGKESD